MHGSLPYDELLHKDVKLIQLLKSIPLPKYIFTNADINHANTCLRIMGLEGLFAVRAETGSQFCVLSLLHSRAWLEVDSVVADLETRAAGHRVLRERDEAGRGGGYPHKGRAHLLQTKQTGVPFFLAPPQTGACS